MYDKEAEQEEELLREGTQDQENQWGDLRLKVVKDQNNKEVGLTESPRSLTLRGRSGIF